MVISPEHEALMCGISALTRDSRKLFCCLLPASQAALVVKNPHANAGDIRDMSLLPGSGRSPGGGHSNPLQYSCLESPMDRGVWDGLQSTKSHRVRYNWSYLSRTHTTWGQQSINQETGISPDANMLVPWSWIPQSSELWEINFSCAWATKPFAFCDSSQNKLRIV